MLEPEKGSPWRGPPKPLPSGLLSGTDDHESSGAGASSSPLAALMSKSGGGNAVGCRPMAATVFMRSHYLATRLELRMCVVTTAQYHRDRAAQFRRHAEHARLSETREMYLRLARTEDAMAELSERRQQSELVAVGQWALAILQDPKKSNGEG